MAKPNNSIAKIKLPGEDTQRLIVPYGLTDGSYYAIVPTLSGDKTLAITDDIPKIKTLNTTLTSAQSTLASESISGTGAINLHKVSKTGKLDDLSNRTMDLLSEPAYTSQVPTLTMGTRVDRLRANRFAGGLHPSSIICETSTNAGTTWSSAGLNDNNKLKLFSSTGASLTIPLKNGVRSTDCMARITLSGIEFADAVKQLSETERFAQMTPENYLTNRVYATVKHLYFWLSAAKDRIAINVYISKGTSKDTWTLCGSHPTASGFSGMDTITLNNEYSFGGYPGQSGNWWFIRITFRTCATDGSFDDSKLSTEQTSVAQTISNILGYGANSWTASHPMGSIDRPYIYDGNNGNYLHEIYRWNGDLFPVSPGTFQLGNASNQWTTIGGKNIYENGTLLSDKYQAKLPTIVKDKYLHTNASTGALEWSTVSSGAAEIVDLTSL